MPRLVVATLMLALAACNRPPATSDNAAQAAALNSDAETLDASPDGLAAPAEGNAANVSEMDD